MLELLINELAVLFISSLFFIPVPQVKSVSTRIDSLIKVSERSPDEEKSKALNELIKIYDTISYDKSLFYSLQSLEISKKHNNEKNIDSLLFNIGKIQYMLGSYDKSIDYFIESLKIREKSNNRKSVAEAYNMLGAVYKELNDNNKALEYFQKAWNLYKDIGDIPALNKVSNNLGIIYMLNGDYDKASTCYYETLNFSKKTDDKNSLCTALNNIGVLYWYQKNYKKALNYYLEALDISQKARNKWSISNTSINIGDVYTKLQDYVKSEYYINYGLKIAQEINSKPLIRDCYITLAEMYYTKTQYKEAYDNLQKYSDIKDSVFTDEIGKNIAKMQVKFEILSKEKENEILKKENEINTLRLKRQTNQRNLLIISTLSILIITLGLYRSFLLKKKNNKILESAIKKVTESEAELKDINIQKDKLFSIIAHDLRNPIGSIIGLTDILDNEAENLSLKEIKEISKHLNTSTNNILILIDNLLDWSRSQEGKIILKPSYINVKEIVDSCIEIISLSAKEKNISLKSEIESNTIVFADRNTITTVIRNILSNSVKFTPDNGSISVKCIENKSGASISIKDTGIGISKDRLSKLFNIGSCNSTKGTKQESGTGLGLIICKEFTEKNNGSINVESELNVGTTFTITLPNENVVTEPEKNQAPRTELVS